MSKSYLIKLRPFDYYFFGGEETFDNGAKGLTNYLVKSNILPQQTGLLGLMRHAFYPKYNIGESFSTSNTNFGVIEEISPVFLINPEGEFLFPAPININPKGALVDVSFTQSNSSFVNGNWVSGIPQALNYNAKEGFENYWLSPATFQLVSENRIFKKNMHIGINKAKRKADNTDQEAFYKQEFVTLTEGYSFGFIAKLDDNVEPADIPASMPFGGEKRTFQVDVKEAGQDWEEIKLDLSQTMQRVFPGNTGAVTLLSDTYVSKLSQLYSLIDFGVMDEKPFRSITTPAALKNFAALSMKNSFGKERENTLIKNDKVLYLLKQGSVLFVKASRKKQLEELLRNNTFEKIGYNQYISNF